MLDSTIHVYQMQIFIGMAEDKKLELPGKIISRTRVFTSSSTADKRLDEKRTIDYCYKAKVCYRCAQLTYGTDIH